MNNRPRNEGSQGHGHGRPISTRRPRSARRRLREIAALIRAGAASRGLEVMAETALQLRRRRAGRVVPAAAPPGSEARRLGRPGRHALQRMRLGRQATREPVAAQHRGASLRQRNAVLLGPLPNTRSVQSPRGSTSRHSRPSTSGVAINPCQGTHWPVESF